MGTAIFQHYPKLSIECQERREKSMNNIQVLDIMYQTFQLVLKLALPFLLVSMVVGVTIAIFQAAT